MSMSFYGEITWVFLQSRTQFLRFKDMPCPVIATLKFFKIVSWRSLFRLFIKKYKIFKIWELSHCHLTMCSHKGCT